MPFTELKLFGFLQTPGVLKDLVRWPARLEIFSFQFGYGTDYSENGLYEDWSLGTLGPILEIHKETLHCILVTNVCKRGLDGFNLSDFTKLRSLNLSEGTTGTDTSLITNIVAPSLHELHWDLTLEDQQCQIQIESFGQPQENWLRALIDSAVERKSALRKIHVMFEPDCYVYGGSVDLDTMKYPWDRMDAVARDAHFKGIKLSYSEPAISKEDFENNVARAKLFDAHYRRQAPSNTPTTPSSNSPSE